MYTDDVHCDSYCTNLPFRIIACVQRKDSRQEINLNKNESNLENSTYTERQKSMEITSLLLCLCAVS